MMPTSNESAPSKKALAKLRELIAQNATIEEAVKEAVLMDLSGQSPEEFEQLNATLEAELPENETQESQSK